MIEEIPQRGGRIGQEDHEAIFEQWLIQHRGIIAKIIRSFTANPSDAEDLFQDITFALWRSIPSFRGESQPSTWIWRIALNQALSWKRSEKSNPATHQAASKRVSENSTEQAVLVDRIYEAIRALKPIDRSLMMLSLDGCSYSEISMVTGLSETNVGARLTRARQQLNQQLKETP